MRQRLGWLVGGVLLLGLIFAACSGGKSAIIANPTTGADVCAGLEGASQFNYVLEIGLSSPKPEGPIDESAVGDPPLALLPTFEDFEFVQKHDGSFIRPDRIDIELSVPGQPAVRTILIGERQWFNLGGTWTEEANPGFPFSPPRVCSAALSTVDLTSTTATAETVDDVEARRFRVEGVAMETAADLWGATSDMGRLLKSYDVDVWLSEDGSLVKLESISTAAYPSGRELTMTTTMQVGPYDEKGIEIEAPI